MLDPFRRSGGILHMNRLNRLGSSNVSVGPRLVPLRTGGVDLTADTQFLVQVLILPHFPIGARITAPLCIV